MNAYAEPYGIKTSRILSNPRLAKVETINDVGNTVYNFFKRIRDEYTVDEEVYQMLREKLVKIIPPIFREDWWPPDLDYIHARLMLV